MSFYLIPCLILLNIFENYVGISIFIANIYKAYNYYTNYIEIYVKGGELLKRKITAMTFAMFILLFFSLLSFNKPVKAASNVTVTVSVLNVRTGPGTEYKKIDSIKLGQTYTAISSQNGWYRLQIGTSTGWVCGDYVKVGSLETTAPSLDPIQGETEGTSVVDKVTVNVSLLNVRTGSSTKYPIIGGIKMGSTYTVLEKDPSVNWYKIQFGTKQGWICGDYVQVSYKVITKEQDAPNETALSNINVIDEIKIYNTGTKYSIAIPVTLKIKKDDSTIVLNPGTTHQKTEDGKIRLSITNSTFNGSIKSIIGKDSDLYSIINIETKADNIIEIIINSKTNVYYEVSNIQSKSQEDNDYRYLKAYVVVDLRKVEDAATLPQDAKPLVSIEKNKENKIKSDYTIALDAGHGGLTSGAVNDGYEEKAFNMDIIMRLNKILKAQGYDTYLTREGDTYVSLLERADAANILNLNILISVHLNSFTSRFINGTETLYNQGDSQSERLASLLQKNIIAGLGTSNRGIKERPDLAMLNSTQMPAALAEVLFMSNDADFALVNKEAARQKTAEAIAMAVNEYFGFTK